MIPPDTSHEIFVTTEVFFLQNQYFTTEISLYANYPNKTFKDRPSKIQKYGKPVCQ